MHKKFVILIVLFLVILIVWIFAFGNWINSVALKLLRGESTQQKPAIVEEPVIKNIFGIEMQSDCHEKYEDFIKNYGADYEKCLKGFDFTAQYCGGFDPETQALSNENVVVILDASGSMAENFGKERKIDVAKKAVANFLINMPQGVNTGLIVYGHRGSNSEFDKEFSCEGIEEVIKLGRNNSSKIISAINSFEPRGWTPIAASIDFASEIFKNTNPGDKNYLILLSDGTESCGGDQVLAAEDFHLKFPNVKFVIIGLAGATDLDFSLEKIANYGGGYYLRADNSSVIGKVFNNQLLVIKRECLSVTLSKLYSGYKSTIFDNLNCWLNAYKKESEDLDVNVVKKSGDNQRCNQVIADALRARHTDFWLKKQDLEKKQELEFKKVEVEYTSQIKALEKQYQPVY